MIELYLRIYRNSLFGTLAARFSAVIMRLWRGSFLRFALYGEWGRGFDRPLEFAPLARLAGESAIIGAVTGAYNRLYGLAGKIFDGSFFLRLAGGFFGVKSLEGCRGVWLVALTVLCIPVLPTKFILGLCVIVVGLFVCRVITGRAAVRLGTGDFFTALFAALVAVSIPLSYIPSESAQMGLVYILFIMFYFAVVNAVDTREKLFAVASALLLTGFFVAALGILQKHTGYNFAMTEAWIDTEMFDETSTRVYSTLQNPNVLGGYLIFVILLAFGGVYYFPSWFHKLISLGVFGAASLCMVYTLSRGAWLGLVFALALFTLFKDRRLIWLGVAALPALPFVMPRSVLDRLLSIGNLNDSSSAYRMSIWTASVNMIKDFWPIGIGPGTDVFTYIYQKYSFSMGYASHSHNLFLQLVIDYGLAGLILFLCLVFMLYRSYLSRLECTRDSFLTSFGAAACAAMGGYLAQGLTDNVWYNYRVVALFWAVAALITACGRVMGGGKTGEGDIYNEEKV